MKQIIITINDDKLLAPLSEDDIAERLNDAIYETLDYVNLCEILLTDYDAGEDLSENEIDTIVQSVGSAVDIEIK